MSSNDIYVPFERVWSDEETKTLIELWDGSRNYDVIRKALPRFSRAQIYQKARHIGLKFNTKLVFWTPEETALLVEVWPNAKSVSEIRHLFPGRNDVAIDRRAYSIKLKKTEYAQNHINELKRQMLINRNQTVLGEKQSYERCVMLASECASRQEFKKKHDSVYGYARIHGFLDEICKHMIVGDSFSYPQAFLFECIKQLFPTEKILYNDRKTIRPKELDIYLPGLNLAFEYDGIRYHKNDDDSKDVICLQKGITLFHIKEKCKTKPERHIIATLETFGFDCSQIDVEHATNEAFTKKLSEKSIIERVSKFKTMKEFRSGDKTLYAFLHNKKLLDRYCSGLVQCPKQITRQELIEYFQSKTSKNEILSCPIGMRYYRKFKKLYNEDTEVASLYNSLKTGR